MDHSKERSLRLVGSPKERLDLLAERDQLDADRRDRVAEMSREDWCAYLDACVENVIEVFPLPLSVATGFVVNGNERLAPMVTEERTVVAAASKGAKLCRPKGFDVKVRPSVAVAQLLYPRPDSPAGAVARVQHAAPKIIEALRRGDRMVARGGGPFALDARIADSPRGALLIVEARIDVRDAMGANAATETGHRVGELLWEELDMRPKAVICGNDVPERRATVRAVWRAEDLGEDLAKRLARPTSETARGELGRSGIDRLLDVQAWAEADPARAVTHVKGIMNGVTAVALATGQDTRALEAAVWAEACRGGACRPMTEYKMTSTGDLYGKLEIPIVAGTVGGATGHPMARFARGLGSIAIGERNARGLVEIMAAVGLAQNFAALWSLAHEGIIASHEKLGRKRP